MSLELFEQLAALQDTPPIKNPVAQVPTTILSSSHSNKPTMSDFDSTCLSATGVKPTNGTADSFTGDTAQPSSAPPTLDGIHPSGPEPDNAMTSLIGPLRDVDPQIIEALRGKDRIYVLKLGEMMESLIDDQRRQRMEMTPITSYQRLLVHRCSAYYKLAPETDPMSKTIHVCCTVESRIPVLRISELVPPETSTAPAFKIMRRSSTERRTKPSHQASSVTIEDGDLSDREPSETGSLGGRSNTTGGSAKKHMTIEEREAAYNEARSRIFMGFEEKEKAKDKDINSSSSSLSATSGSTKNGESSAGDADSSSSSPATESEWSGPVRRRQHSGYASASSSTRSIRSSAYISNGSGSSRNSRAASPSSFHFPSLYEPTTAPVPLYDPAQQSAPAAPVYHPPYGYPYNQSQPNPPYMPYHTYYPSSYPTYSAPHPIHSGSDPSTPSHGEPYPPHPPMPYTPPYMWPHPGQPPIQSPPMQPQPVPPQPPSNHPHHMNPPPPGQPTYQPYLPPPHTYPYPMPGYYPSQPVPPPPGPPLPHPPHMSGPQLYDPRMSSNGTGIGQANGFRNNVPNSGVPLPANGRPLPRNGYVGPNNGNGPRPRNGPMQPGRAPWSHGPGVGPGSFTGVSPQPNETVGPRLSNNRRQSNMSNSSVNGRSTSGDDSSSVTSSASSSSRKPQTVNAGSQHPLPPRPDWAINLMPQNSRNMSPISPPRNTSGGSIHSNYSPRHPQSNSQSSSQSTDFPPLSTVQPSERRAPAGAWGNLSRPIFGQASNNGTNDEMGSRLDESSFERPPPKSAELYNPKTPKRTLLNTNYAENDKAQSGNGEVAAATTGLTDQVAGLSLRNGAPAGFQL